jgi:L-asparagine transporter-like permease
VRLWGAPATPALVIVFLAGVLFSTTQIDGLDTAWQAGVPFFVVLVLVYLGIRRARGGAVDGTDNVLEAELAARRRDEQVGER